MDENLFVDRTGKLVLMRRIQANSKGTELDLMKTQTYRNSQICLEGVIHSSWPMGREQCDRLFNSQLIPLTISHLNNDSVEKRGFNPGSVIILITCNNSGLGCSIFFPSL